MNTTPHSMKSLPAASLILLLLGGHCLADAKHFTPNGIFHAAKDSTAVPADFTLTGDADFGTFGDPKTENNGHGLRLIAGGDFNKDGRHEATLTTIVKALKHEDGRWFRLRALALVQPEFPIESVMLHLKVEFLRDGGTNALDHITREFSSVIAAERRILADKGTNKNLGPATWRSFDLEFRTPFPEVDALKLSVGFRNGEDTADHAECWISELQLSAIPVPADYAQPANEPRLSRDLAKSMVPLGGRWYFDPRGGDRAPPAQFDHSNADRLFYLSAQLETPFIDNMTAWFRKGYRDAQGDTVIEDEFVPDNLIISFDKTHMIVRSRGLPNHPTGIFPDKARYLDGNPNYLQEKVTTTRIPLEPRENKDRLAMQDATNNNNALPGGPIGVAVNGIVFFNPFDHLLDADAVWRLDRCCGHPSPRAQYHYHKYPVCIKSPWADDGSEHSPLIGFAYDGYPIYGPYESKGLLAKDDTRNPINEFNIHRDEERGWHYHVTPGKFPHVIGGYWGVAEMRHGAR